MIKYRFIESIPLLMLTIIILQGCSKRENSSFGRVDILFRKKNELFSLDIDSLGNCIELIEQNKNVPVLYQYCFSEKQLKEIENRVHSFSSRTIKNSDNSTMYSPNFAINVYKEGELIYKVKQGFMDEDELSSCIAFIAYILGEREQNTRRQILERYSNYKTAINVMDSLINR